MIQKIALHGKMKSGKTTLAEAFQEGTDPFEVDIASFAGPLKRGLAMMNIHKGHPLYRQTAQYIGTDIIRDYDPNWWVKLMDMHYQANIVDPFLKTIIIDDLRFPNELEWCEMAGFLTVKLEVSEYTQILRGADPVKLNHESDTALDDLPDGRWDLILPEDTSVEERMAAIYFELAEKDAYAGTAVYS